MALTRSCFPPSTRLRSSAMKMVMRSPVTMSASRHPRVADEDHALLGVVVLRTLRGPHPAVAGDDTDVARGHHPLHPVRLGVRVHLHLVRILDGVVLARDHVALEDGQPLPLEAVEAVRVHDDGGILV